MRFKSLQVAATAFGLMIVSGTAQAGWPFHKHGGSDCGCNTQTVAVVATPVVHVAPVADCGCACASVATSCCGVGGGISHLGNVYGLGVQSDVLTSGHVGGTGFGSAGSGVYAGGGLGLTGYEGLPNMDGGGTNHRYPYHSYRRPWAFPGPTSTNVSIVW